MGRSVFGAPPRSLKRIRTETGYPAQPFQHVKRFTYSQPNNSVWRESNLLGFSKKVKLHLQQIWPSVSNLAWWTIGIMCGALITHWIESILNREKEETDLARYYVAAMPSHCRPNSSRELDEQIKRFIEATRRARAAGEGIPVWREDCSIGADLSIKLHEQIGVKEEVIVKPIPKRK